MFHLCYINVTKIEKHCISIIFRIFREFIETNIHVFPIQKIKDSTILRTIFGKLRKFLKFVNLIIINIFNIYNIYIYIYIYNKS